jgi:hypothetical protein
MVFGMTGERLRRVTVVGGVLGGLVLAVALWVAYSHSRLRTAADLVQVVIWALVIGAILPAAVGLAGALRVRIEREYIDQLVGPWVVARRPAKELRRMIVEGRLFPAQLEFADGKRFRLLALHVRDHALLADAVRTAAPDAVIEGRGWRSLPTSQG